MRTVKTMLMLAVATAAMSAFAAPAFAGVWTEEGLPLEESKIMDLGGTVRAWGVQDWITCDLDGEATLDVGGKGEITKFDLSECSYPNIWNPECNHGSSSPTTLPWPIEAQSSPARMLVKDMVYTVKLSAPCNTTRYVDIDAALQPDNPFLMSELTFSGSSGGIAVGGDIDVIPAGFFGIE